MPWSEIVRYLEAIVRVYNAYGRRDNLYKARIKILVKAQGQAFIDAVQAEFEALQRDDALGAALRLSDAALARMQAMFEPPHAWLATAAHTDAAPPPTDAA